MIGERLARARGLAQALANPITDDVRPGSDAEIGEQIERLLKAEQLDIVLARQVLSPTPGCSCSTCEEIRIVSKTLGLR